MQRTWWSYSWDPQSREVTVERWVQHGNCWAHIEVSYPGLTWGEALDVFDADSSYVLRCALGF